MRKAEAWWQRGSREDAEAPGSRSQFLLPVEVDEMPQKSHLSEMEITLPSAIPGAQLIKNLPEIRETWVQALCWEDPLEKATHSSILAW